MSTRSLLYTGLRQFQDSIQNNSRVEKFLQKLTVEVEEQNKCTKLEKMGNFYRAYCQEQRIMAHKIVEEIPNSADPTHPHTVVIYVLLDSLTHKQHGNIYDNQHRREDHLRGRLDHFTAPRSQEKYLAWKEEKLAIPEPQIPRPSTEEYNVLWYSWDNLHVDQNIWIYETPEWIEQCTNPEVYALQDHLDNIPNIIEKVTLEYGDTVPANTVRTYAYNYRANNPLTLVFVRFENTEEESTQTRYLLIACNPSPDIIERYDQKLQTLLPITQYAVRAYPVQIMLDKQSTWQNIQRDKSANLALSPEEQNILDGALHNSRIHNNNRYPLFINGRPGSGKSTILQYIYAVYFHISLIEVQPFPLFLTYSESLCKVARNNISNLLSTNGLLHQSHFTKEEILELLDEHVCSYRNFLKRQLPPEEQDKLVMDKYINYAKFQKLMEKRTQDKKNQDITAELSWHVIRTYIKGIGGSEGNFAPEDYKQHPEKQKTVSDAVFEKIYDTIWTCWYKNTLQQDGFWDDQDLTNKVLDIQEQIQQEKQIREINNTSAIFCDESQDFTKQELEFIFNLSLFAHKTMYTQELKHIPFIFAGDPFQTLNPTGFNWKVLESDFYQQIRDGLRKGDDNIKLDINFQELFCNYRSAQSIVRFCNTIQLLRGHVLNDFSIHPQEVYVKKDSPKPSFFTIADAKEVMHLPENQSINILIPCAEGAEGEYWQSDSDLTSLIGLWENEKGKPVFSPMEAKGLEFPRIVLYKFGAYILGNPVIQSIIEQKILHPNTEFTHEENLPVSYFFNSLYVAASRAKDRILIVDTETALEQIWGKLFCESNIRELLNSSQNTKQQPWEYDKHTIDIVKGEQSDWSKNKEDPTEMAHQYLEKGKDSENPKMLFKAETTFTNIGENYLAKKARAYRLYYSEPPEYVEAGTLFQNLGSEEKILALECFWIEQQFPSILDLDPEVVVQRPAYIMSKFIQSGRDISDCIYLLTQITKWLEDQQTREIFQNLRNHKSSFKYVDQKLQEIIEKEFLANTLVTEKWKTIQDQLYILQYEKHLLSYSITYLQPAYKTGDYKLVTKLWVKLPNKPPFHKYPRWINEAFIATTPYPKVVEYLHNNEEYQRITDLYSHYNNSPIQTELTAEQIKIVIQSFIQQKLYTSALLVLKNHNSEEGIQLLLKAPIYQYGENQEFAQIAAQKLLEHWITNCGYEQIENLLQHHPTPKMDTGLDIVNTNQLYNFIIRFLATIKRKEIQHSNRELVMIHKEKLLAIIRQHMQKQNHSVELQGLALETLYTVEQSPALIEYYKENLSTTQNKYFIHERCAYILHRYILQIHTVEDTDQLDYELKYHLQMANKKMGDLGLFNEIEYERTPEYQQTRDKLKFLLYPFDTIQYIPSPANQEITLDHTETTSIPEATKENTKTTEPQNMAVQNPTPTTQETQPIEGDMTSTTQQTSNTKTSTSAEKTPDIVDEIKQTQDISPNHSQNNINNATNINNAAPNSTQQKISPASGMATLATQINATQERHKTQNTKSPQKPKSSSPLANLGMPTVLDPALMQKQSEQNEKNVTLPNIPKTTKSASPTHKVAQHPTPTPKTDAPKSTEQPPLVEDTNTVVTEPTIAINVPQKHTNNIPPSSAEESSKLVATEVHKYQGIPLFCHDARYTMYVSNSRELVLFSTNHPHTCHRFPLGVDSWSYYIEEWNMSVGVEKTTKGLYISIFDAEERIWPPVFSMLHTQQ